MGGEEGGGRGGSRIGAGAGAGAGGGHRAGETENLVSDLRSRLSKVSLLLSGISVFGKSAIACIQTLNFQSKEFAERARACSMP